MIFRMGNETSVKLTALQCSQCRAAVKSGLFGGLLGKLKKIEGRCESCRGPAFDAEFVVTRNFVEGPGDAALGGAAAGSALASAAIGGILFATPGSTSGKTQRPFELKGVSGQDLLENLDAPPEAQIAWIVAVLKASAKSNLAADQGLCQSCGEIFHKGETGPTAQGYCSPLCMKKAAGPAASAPQAVDCPKCGRKVRLKAGVAKCMFCGTTTPT